MTNPLVQQARQATDILVDLFSQDGQTNTSVIAEAIKKGAQIEGLHTDITGTFSSLPLVQFVPTRTRGMPSGVKLISQSIWTEDITRLVKLEAKVVYVEWGVKNLIDAQFEI